jgi:hypothetical protein
VAVSRKKDHENRKVLGVPAHFEEEGHRGRRFFTVAATGNAFTSAPSKVIHSRREKNRK